MSIVQGLITGYDNPPLLAVDGADFDGTNDWMDHAGGLAGAADSKTGILSCWVRLDGGNGTSMNILGANAANVIFLLSRISTNVFRIQADNAADSNILHISSTSSYTAGATWRHVLASWDLATTTAHLYVGDSADLTTTTLTNDTIDYTLDNWFIAKAAFLASRLNGCVADLYFAPGQYLDFSVTANRRKFISAGGKPVWMGVDGSLPTGTAPLVYQHLDNGEAVANFALNRGSANDFVITGTLDTSSTSPSD